MKLWPLISQTGADAESSVFELKWHDGEYCTAPALFQGFFERELYLYSYSQSFLHPAPAERALVRLEGRRLHHSARSGSKSSAGFRRQQVALSYADIQRYSGIVNPTHLASALKHALGANYISRIEEGRFDPNAGRASKAAVYGLKWATDATKFAETGSKRIAV